MSQSLLLCATTRLAQTRRAEVPAGQAVWRTRAALTPAQWLATLADEALLSGVADLPVGLDPFAERLIWEKVIAASLTDAAPLFDLPGMAASAAEAHALARVWQLDPTAGELSDEARLFVGWRSAFLDQCAAGGWLDQAGLQLEIIALIEAGHFALPETVAFAGFDRYTPLERRLMAALAGRGVQVDAATLLAQSAASTVEALVCLDADAECTAVAAWACAQLAANPAARLGVVAPDLASLRDRLEFRLDDALHPCLLRPAASEAPRCFNFSLGRALADLPLIRVGLDLLALGSARAKVEQQRLSALLLAGGWSAAEAEADGRARLAAAMRRDLPYFTTLPALVRLAERLAEQGTVLCPQTVQSLQAFIETTGSFGRKLLPGQWSGAFRSCLKAAGWPGDRALSSHEFQARRALGEVLDAFAQFDALLGTLPLNEAVRRLTQLCRQRIFQPETRGQPSIQVLGVLESAGLAFDALWVMGMNDDVWPPAPRPNPLLSSEMQRAAGAAHASAEVELDFARRVQARLLQSAPQVTFSCSQASGNRILRPSPLIADVPRTAPGLVLAPTLLEKLASQAAALDRLADAEAPPVAAGEKVSGGSWILRAQAICPAWAYFQFRLGAKAMEEPVEGLDPAARGTLVHEALEAFWTAIRSSSALAALDEMQRRTAITEAVAQALQNFELDRRITLPARFRELEAARLARLLDVWLAVEARRKVDFEVVACEQPAEVEIEDIRVKMVVDRIDQLADGRQVIIDYKTGASIDTKNWAEQRITEPQLPIYAALINDEVAAVVFAKVLLDKPAFAGVAEEKDILPGVQGVGDDKQKTFDPAEFPDWVAVVTHWRERLHAIAREVKEGRAGVMFADEKALQYCDVLPLLRLPERRRLLAEAQAGEQS